MTAYLEIDTLLKNSIGIGFDLDEVDQAELQRILIVDDEIDTIDFIKQLLRISGFTVMSAMSLMDAELKISEYHPHLIVVDLGMKGHGGLTAINALRQITEIPIIAISADSRPEDVVLGFQQGADDCIVQSFHGPELVERVRAVLRRYKPFHSTGSVSIINKQLVLDPIHKEVLLCEKSVRLTPKEYAILALLTRFAPAVVPYSSISKAIWGIESDRTRSRTKYLVYLLRKKLEDALPGSPTIINDRLGYRLDLKR